jgi:hypothetical protein
MFVDLIISIIKSGQCESNTTYTIATAEELGLSDYIIPSTTKGYVSIIVIDPSNTSTLDVEKCSVTVFDKKYEYYCSEEKKVIKYLIL